MIPEGTLTKPLDVVLLVGSILRRLDAGGMKTFEQRLKTQKIQYFAQLFNVSPNYNFTLYLRGPYSSHLANDLFRLEEAGVEYNSEKFISNALEERFIGVREFVKDKNIRELEVIATLHWLINVAGLSKEAANKKLIELKSPSKEEIEKANKALAWLPK